MLNIKTCSVKTGANFKDFLNDFSCLYIDVNYMFSVTFVELLWVVSTLGLAVHINPSSKTTCLVSERPKMGI